jgi:hypothetical protein
LSLLERLQTAKEVELVGEQGAVRYVIHHLLALPERVPVDAATALHPLELVGVVVALVDLFPAEFFQRVLDPLKIL